MAMLNGNECWRVVKPVEIGAVLADLPRLPFVAVGGSSPEKYKCDVVLAAHFTPALNEFIAGLGLGGTQARAVLRRLAPKQNIPPHVDDWIPAEADWRRFQVPLISDPEIKMRWPDEDVETHLQPGFLYEVRFDRKHEVVNNADCARIHMQIDQIDATI